MSTFAAELEGERRASGFIDVTDAIRAAVQAGPVRDGRVTVVADDPRDRLLANERESGLFADLKDAIDRMGDKAALIGARSITVPIRNGDVCLGEWQRILVIAPHATAAGAVTAHVMGD